MKEKSRRQILLTIASLLIFLDFSLSLEVSICLQVFRKSTTIYVDETDPPGTSLVKLDLRVRDKVKASMFLEDEESKELPGLVKVEYDDVKLAESLRLETILRLSGKLAWRLTLQLTCDADRDSQSEGPDTKKPLGGHQYTNVYTVIINPNARRATRFFSKFLFLVGKEDVEVGDKLLVMRMELLVYIQGFRRFPNPTYGRFYLEQSANESSQDLTRYVKLDDAYWGTLHVFRKFNFENMRYSLQMNVVHENPARQRTTATLFITLLDVHDVIPDFYTPDCSFPCLVLYQARVGRTDKGEIEVEPANIKARSGNPDTPGMLYSFKEGTPKNYAKYLSIDHRSGKVYLIRKVTDKSIKYFNLLVEAREIVESGAMFQTTTLVVTVDEGLTLRRSWEETALLVRVALGLAVLNLVLFIICLIVFWHMRVKDSQGMRRLKRNICCLCVRATVHPARLSTGPTSQGQRHTRVRLRYRCKCQNPATNQGPQEGGHLVDVRNNVPENP